MEVNLIYNLKAQTRMNLNAQTQFHRENIECTILVERLDRLRTERLLEGQKLNET